MNLGLAGWSLNRRFKAGRLKLLDYPGQVRDEFGLSVIELNSPFFESTEAPYLDELKRRIDEAGAVVVNIAVDGQGDLAAGDESERRQSVANYAAWFPVAKALGSPCIRAFSGGPHEGELPDEIMNACIASFGELAVVGKEQGIRIIVENHGGVIARDPDNLVKLMESDDTGFLGMCPDFGNFPPEVTYEGLEKVAPWAVVLHAKLHEFDEEGEDLRIDVRRCLEIFRKTDFAGNVLIEFEGKGDDHEGVLKSIELLRRHM